ncbi:MAG: ATP synthase subunit I [Tenericutes bacterium]|nr:ATP synthase subunit I [Mycoplasmatota bacterium]
MKKPNVIELTFLFTWPVSIIVALIIFLISGDWGLVVSYILGVFTVLMMQSMNYRIMKNTFKNNPGNIQRYTIFIYIAKLVLYGIILYVAYNEPNWNIFATLGGIMTYRIVMFPTTIIFAKKGDDDSAV